MTTVFEDNSLSVGRTPLVRLARIGSGAGGAVYAKIESRNPAASVKDRIGAAMIWDAERSGRLRSGMEIVEPTSGNTGIALAFVSAARGYRLTLCMPETMSSERRRIVEAFGANVLLTDGNRGMQGAIEAAARLATADPERYFMPQQFDNPANPWIHETTTGPEIDEALEGQVDYFVAGVGTGGTITGVSRYLKRAPGRAVICVAVEPAASPVLTQTRAGKPVRPGAHRIQGIGAGFVPSILEMDLIDRVETVSDEEALAMTARLAREEGILAGISCGAAVAAALRIAQQPEAAGRTIVTVLPDSGERYLSMHLFDDWAREMD